MKELPEPLVPNDFYKLFLDLQKERCHDATARLVYTILPIAPAGRNDSFSRRRLSLVSRPQRDLRELIFKMPPAHRYADVVEPISDDMSDQHTLDDWAAPLFSIIIIIVLLPEQCWQSSRGSSDESLT